jgi:RNA polymerase sigma factor (sigma-70 family)
VTSAARRFDQARHATAAGPSGGRKAPPNTSAQASSAPPIPKRTVADVDFDAVFQNEYGKLLRYLITQGATSHEADDAVQAAFEQAFTQWRSITSPRPWLYKVARRMFLNSDVRLRQRETPTDDLTSLDTSTDDPVAYTVREHMTVEALQALPYQQRNVMGLALSEFTPSEIADLLGLTAETVRQSLRRARITLKEQMKHAWKETS